MIGQQINGRINAKHIRRINMQINVDELEKIEYNFDIY
jgi:hypothetical protein